MNSLSNIYAEALYSMWWNKRHMADYSVMRGYWEREALISYYSILLPSVVVPTLSDIYNEAMLSYWVRVLREPA